MPRPVLRMHSWENSPFSDPRSALPHSQNNPCTTYYNRTRVTEQVRTSQGLNLLLLLLLLCFLAPSGLAHSQQTSWVDICGPCPDKCSCSLAFPVVWMCRIDCSQQDLTVLPTIQPVGFLNIRELHLFDNKIETLPDDAFTQLEHLQVLSLRDNPWNCNCSLLWLQGWLWQQASNGLEVDAASVVCAAPAHLAGLPLLAVSSTLLCGAEDLVSCLWDSSTAGHAGRPALFTHASYMIQAEEDCNLFCYDNVTTTAYVFIASGSVSACYCGQPAAQLNPNFECASTACYNETEPASGSVHCGRLYWSSRQVTSGMRVREQRPVSSEQLATFTVDTQVSITHYGWDFNDASSPVNTTGATVGHNYVLPGRYDLQTTLTSMKGRTSLTVVPVTVQDPVKLDNSSEELVASTDQSVDIGVVLQQGSQLTIRWERTNQHGQTITGGSCSPDWLSFGSKCLWVHTDQMNYVDAAVSCQSQAAVLLTLDSSVELQALIKDLNIGGDIFYTGAQKSGAAYIWSSSKTDTYFTQADIDSSVNGDCVTVSNAGLDGTNCDMLHSYICQRATTDCIHGGSQNTATESCYLLVDSSAPWQSAEEHCRDLDGHLASLPDPETSQFVADLMDVSSVTTAWIGLRNVGVSPEGQFLWTEGHDLATHQPWADDYPTPRSRLPGQGCVTMTTDGYSYQWQDVRCDVTQQFVCQYPAAGSVHNIDSDVTGLASFLESAAADVVHLEETTETGAPDNDDDTTLYIMPGMWFSQSGQVQSWQFQTDSVTSDTQLHLQVYRPGCSGGGDLVTPGCAELPSPFATCSDDPVARSHCQQDFPHCESGQHYCPLLAECISSLRPCTCHSERSVVLGDNNGDNSDSDENDDDDDDKNAPSSSCETDKQAEDGEDFECPPSAHCVTDLCPNGVSCFAGSLPGYTLVKDTALHLGVESSHKQHRVAVKGFHIEAGDIIGFQFSDSLNPLFCESSEDSAWRQTMLKLSNQKWSNKNSTISSQEVMSHRLVHNTVCKLRASFTAPVTVSPPSSMTHPLTTPAGNYTYRARVSNAVSGLEKLIYVEVLDPVSGLRLLIPETTLPGQGKGRGSVGTVIVESETTQAFLVKIGKGSKAVLTNSLSDSVTAFNQICPVEYGVLPECSSSGEKDSFALLRHTFDTSADNVSVVITASNKLNAETVAVDILVQERIAGLAIVINSNNDRVAVEEPVMFEAVVDHGTFVNFSWQLSTGDTVVASCSDPSCSHRFSDPGVYTLTVNASNLINNLQAASPIKVYAQSDPISDLQVVTPSTVLDSQAVDITITMSQSHMSILTVFVDYGDDTAVFTQQFDEGTAVNVTLDHVYLDLGAFTVTVSVWDDMTDTMIAKGQSRVTVVPQILDARTSSNSRVSPTRTNVEFIVETVTSTGTMEGLYYAWNFGDNTGESQTSRGIVRHQFTNSGQYTVQVTVSNNITEVYVTTIQNIEEAIKNLELTYDGPTLLGKVTTITAHVSAASDELYHFFDLDNDLELSPPQSKPWIEHMFTETGPHRILVQVNNTVSSASTELIIYVVDDDTLFIASLVVPEVGESGVSIEFSATVICKDLEMLQYRWEFGDGLMVGGDGVDPSSHVYQQPGSYQVSLSVQDGHQTTKDTKDIRIQERIAVINLTGDFNLGIERSNSVEGLFEVNLEKGSDVSFTWDINNQTIATNSPMNSLMFSAPGLYPGFVEVSNNISTEEVTFAVTVQELISELTIDHNGEVGDYFSLDETYNFTAVTQTGSNIAYQWQLNDTLVSDLASFEQKFTDVTTLLLSCTASNDVSEASDEILLTVQDPVENLQVQSNISLASTSLTVHFQASIGHGTEAQYTWHICTSQCTTISTREAAELVYEFPKPGLYQMTVIAQNRISRDVQHIDIQLQEEITGLVIHVTPDLYDDRYVAADSPVTFRADITSGSEVSYEWTLVGDRENTTLGSGRTATHSFHIPGDYTLAVTASNAVGEQRVFLEFEVVKTIQGLVITTSSHLILTREPHGFKATVSEGSDIFYDWHCEGITTDWTLELANHTALLEQAFYGAGVYEVTATVRNVLGSQTTSILVGVGDQIEGIQIKVVSDTVPYIQRDDKVKFRVQPAHPSHEHFWVFSDEVQNNVYKTSVVNHEFHEVGDYTVVVMVMKRSTTKLAITKVSVMEAIRGLHISCKSTELCEGKVIAMREEVTLEASTVEGSAMSYLWKVDDVVVLESNTTSALLHTFDETREYQVEVTASNQLDTDTVRQKVKVITLIKDLSFSTCCSDVIMAGEDTVFQAHTVSGTDLSYEWILYTPDPVIFTGSSSFSYNFESGGVYDLELTSWNDLSKETVTEPLVVRQDLGDVSIQLDQDKVWVGLEVTFSVSVESGGTNLQYVWNLWSLSSLNNYTSSNESFTRTFNQKASYILWVNVSNDVSWAKDRMVFVVRKLECDPPELTPVGGTERTELKSHSITLEVVVEACSWYSVSHEWKLYTGNCTEENKNPLPPYIVSDKPQLVLMPRFLDYGHHCLLFSTEYMRTGCKREVQIQVEIIATELKALIDGGSTRLLASSQEIVLDGTLSYDPDNSSSLTPNLSYEWKCQELGPLGDTNLPLPDEIRNEHPDPSDGGVCFPKSNNSTVVLPAYTLQPGMRYSVTLSVWAFNRLPQNTTQEIMVSHEFTLPAVRIECISCRELNVFAVSRGQYPKLLGSCLNCEGEVHYQWLATRSDNAPLELNETTTTTGANRPNLVIRKGVLQDHFDYTFSLLVQDEHKTDLEGYSSLFLHASLPPSGGSCTLVHPVNGTILALDDRVVIGCQDWIDNSGSTGPLTFHMYVERKNNPKTWYSAYRGPTQKMHFYVAPFEEDAEGGEVVIKVDVIDKLGNEMPALDRTVMVTVPDPGNTTMTDYLNHVVRSTLSQLTNLNNPKLLMQYIVAATKLINAEASKYQDVGDGDPDLEGQKQTRRELRSELLSTVFSRTSVSTMDDVVQVAYTLQLLTKYSNEFPLGDNSYVYVTLLLKQIVELLRPQVSQGWRSEEFVPFYSMSTVGNLLEIIYHHIQNGDAELSLPGMDPDDDPSSTLAPSSPATVPAKNPTVPQSTPSLPTPPSVPPTSDDEISMLVIQTTLNIADDFTYLSLLTQVPEEDPVDFNVGIFHTEGMRVIAGNIRDTLHSSDCTVTLPSTLLSDLPATQDVLQVLSTMQTNPFRWGFDDGNSITSKVVNLYFSHINHSEIHLSDLPDNERVHIEMPSCGLCDNDLDLEHDLDANRKKRSLIDWSPVKDRVIPSLFKRKGLTFDHVLLPAGGSTSTELNITVATSGGSIHIQVLTEFLGIDLSDLEEDLSVDAYVGSGFEPSEDMFNYSLHITPDMMEDLDNFTQYTFFILDQSSGAESNTYFLTLVNNAADASANVSVGVYVSQCKFYNSSQEVWQTTGCLPSELSTPDRTHCHCSHMTLYGTSVLVSPAETNFRKIWRPDVSSNPIALITVLMLGLLYACAALLGRRWDVLALRRISIIPLCGRDGPYKYEVTVITGRRKGAGTTAHVGLQLYGEQGRTPSVHLHKPEAFQRNSHEVLLVASETDLGELWKIRVWHDNAGLSPSWYLTRILIRDLQTNQKYYFLVDDWLAVDKEKGIKRDVLAAGANDLSKFKTVFSAEASRGMVDRHLWVSMLERPAQSRFTRLQRASVCITALYAYLMLNAVWFGAVRTPSDTEALTGTMVFTWEDVVASVVAGLIIFPVLLGLILLFRKTKAQRDPWNYGPKPGTAQTVEMDAWIDIDSRPSSAFTVRANREVFELDDIEGPDRESTLESMPVRGRGLRRTKPFVRMSRRDSLLSDTASLATTTAGTEPNKKSVGLPPDEPLWSYDTILTWPEKLPVPSWQENRSNRRNSCGDSNILRHRGRRNSISLDNQNCSRRMSTSSTDAAKDVTRTEVTEVKGEPHKADVFNPRDEAVLEDLEEAGAFDEALAQLDTHDKPLTRKRSWSTGSFVSQETTFIGGQSGPMTSSLTPGYYTNGRHRSWSNRSDSVVMAAESLPAPDGGTAEKYRLPYWCLYLAYVLCLTLSACSVTVTLVYGWRFNQTAALYWLLTCCLTFLLSALVLEPLKVLVVAVFIALMGRTLDEDLDSVQTTAMVESSEKIKDVKVRPMGGFALLQAKEERQKLSRMHLLLRQFIAYLLFLWLLLAINYSAYNKWSYYVSNHQRNIFTAQTYDGYSRGFYDIDRYSAYWDWLEEVGAPAIHLEQSVPNTTHGYLVGRARLRQVRSQQVTCSAKDQFLSMSADYLRNLSCYGSSDWREDTQEYGLGWVEDTANGTWTHTRDTGSGSTVGQVARYGGGGYIQELGLTYEDTLARVQSLRDNIWIDRGTRAVFLEFTLYNANLRLYGVVSLLVEFALSGGALPSETMETIQLYKLETGFVIVLTICMCLLFAVFFYLGLHVIFSVRKLGWRYFSKFWHWLELSLLALTLTSFAVYIHTLTVHSGTSGRLREHRDDYVAFSDSVYWSCVWRYINAVLLFLLTLVIVYQLRFIKPLSKYGRTLRAASGKIMGCALFFLLITLAYGMLGYLWYGTTVHVFRGVPQAMFSMVSVLKGHTPFFEDMISSNNTLVFITLFTATFVTLMYVVVFGLILAALTNSYKMVKQQMFYHNSLDVQDYEMISFTMKRFKRWLGITKPKPAFRRVKFQGMPSLSSRSTSSHSGPSWAPSCSDSSGLGVLDEEQSALYLESLLDRAVPTWDNMLEKLDQVVEDEEEEDIVLKQFEETVTRVLQQQQARTASAASLPPVPPPRRSRTLSATTMKGETEVPSGKTRRISVSSDSGTIPKRPPRKRREIQVREVWS